MHSFDGNLYICSTCHKNLVKNEISCQSIVNKLNFFIPSHLSDIRKLEKTLIAHRIIFPKVLITPKGEFPKLQRAICNIPIKSLNNVCNVLPRGAGNSVFINIELKRKLSYKNSIISQQVRHQKDIKVLKYLFQNNHLYSHVEIDDSNISCNEENIDFVIDDIDEKNYITFVQDNTVIHL